MSPDVSVCIPVYNGENYIEQAVRSALMCDPSEVIVYSDGSSDRTCDIVLRIGDARVSLIEADRNMGIGHARYRCIEEASCRYLSFLSHDDYYERKDFLERNIYIYRQKKSEINKPLILYSGYIVLNEKSGVRNEFKPIPYGFKLKDFHDIKTAILSSALRNTMFINFSTIFGETSLFKKFQFDRHLRQCEDLEFLLRTSILNDVPYVYTGINDGVVYRAGDNTTSRTFTKIPEINREIFRRLGL